MKLVLISTSNIESGRVDVLERMVSSVERAATVLDKRVSIRILLLLQKCPEYRYWALSKSLPPFVQAIPSTDALSLSAARNLLLSYAISNGMIDSATVVGFPDDDCWYPAGVLESVAHAFATTPELGLWFSKYSSTPVPIVHVGAATRASARDVIREISSNTMFVRGRVLRSAPVFDESLGVGTVNGGGEDTEFGLRAYLSSAQSLYVPAAVIGHRDKSPQLRPKYYRGGLIALARHAKQQPRIGVEFARKLAVGVWLVGTRQLPVAAFRTAVSAALKSRQSAAA
ncbi:glycosyltransferase family 2 protein [Pseudolabrys sp. FHR47]|uniref:glycosyltransferase family 2 protein n=1 Tax=Pseudolabrys sp. FHR47 TaxID=2562284 RepID=UPI0010BE386E|nr:hypothetical protein [Pseudolabrys sp. FHR47]